MGGRERTIVTQFLSIDSHETSPTLLPGRSGAYTAQVASTVSDACIHMYMYMYMCMHVHDMCVTWYNTVNYTYGNCSKVVSFTPAR